MGGVLAALLLARILASVPKCPGHCQTQQQLFVKSVSFVAGLKCATRVSFIEGSDSPRVCSAALKALICPINMGLLGREVWVMLAHFGV